MSPELRKSVARCQAILDGQYHEAFPSALPVTRMDLGRVLEYVGRLERWEATPPPRPTASSEAIRKARSQASAAESRLAWALKMLVLALTQIAQAKRNEASARQAAATAKGQAAAADRRRKSAEAQLWHVGQELNDARMLIAQLTRKPH